MLIKNYRERKLTIKKITIKKILIFISDEFNVFMIQKMVHKAIQESIHVTDMLQYT